MFGQFLGDKVANPKDVLLYSRRSAVPDNCRTVSEGEMGAGGIFENEQNDNVSIETMISEGLSKSGLTALPESGLSEAVRAFVNKDDNNSIKELVCDSFQMLLYLMSAN